MSFYFCIVCKYSVSQLPIWAFRQSRNCFLWTCCFAAPYGSLWSHAFVIKIMYSAASLAIAIWRHWIEKTEKLLDKTTIRIGYNTQGFLQVCHPHWSWPLSHLRAYWRQKEAALVGPVFGVFQCWNADEPSNAEHSCLQERLGLLLLHAGPHVFHTLGCFQVPQEATVRTTSQLVFLFFF